jgi:molecular chaperone DnaK (HSP70)
MAARKFEIPAIGIELGMNNSCVAVWQGQNNRAEIMHNELGFKTTPFVSFTDGKMYIGDAAKSKAASNPSNTIFGNSNFLLFIHDNLLLTLMVIV